MKYLRHFGLDNNEARIQDFLPFVSSGWKIVNWLWRQKYDPVIIERNIDLMLGTSSALYISFLERCTLTNKIVGLYDGICPNLPRGDQALILVPSDCFFYLIFIVVNTHIKK